MTLKGGAKFKEKLICGLKKDIRNLVNFYMNSRKSENLLFDRILLPKAVLLYPRKRKTYSQRIYV